MRQGETIGFGRMMNRPRPRKIINVIKTSSSTKIVEETGKNEFAPQNSISLSPTRNSQKPSSPVVPQFNPKTNSVTGTGLPANASANNNINTVTSHNNVTIHATSSMPIASSISASNSTPPPSNFTPRKPIVATLKKAHFPPPPTFSDSPKSSPIVGKPILEQSTRNFTQNDSDSSQSLNSSLSPKSSGETFLDSADKAADFIGGALLLIINHAHNL